MKKQGTATLNRRALHDYSIEESIEAGIVLKGTEIKSIREGRVNLSQAYARVENGEVWLLNSHIAHYPGGNRYNHEPTRPRKLLLNRKEINRLASRVAEKGLTLVPVKLYFKNHRAKLELGLGRGKKMHDKRQSIARRETDKAIERAIKMKHRS
jgi:SsrA-binding protein